MSQLKLQVEWIDIQDFNSILVGHTSKLPYLSKIECSLQWENIEFKYEIPQSPRFPPAL